MGKGGQKSETSKQAPTGCLGPRHGSASDCFIPTFRGSSGVTCFRLPCLNPGNVNECTRVTCCEHESVSDVQPRTQMSVTVSPPWLYTSRVIILLAADRV